MKLFLSLITTLFLAFSIQAEVPAKFESKISVKGKKHGSASQFLGKLNDSYLFSYAPPSGIGGNKFYISAPPKLFLAKKNGNLVATNDLEDQFKKAKVKYAYFFGIVLFNDKLFCIYSMLDKAQKTESIYMAEINSKTLAINFRNKKNISEGLYEKRMTLQLSSTLVHWNVSEDKSKLAITVSQWFGEYAKQPEESYRLLHTQVFDKDLKLLTENSFDTDSKDIFDKRYVVYDVNVNNKGETTALLSYNIEQPKGPHTNSSALHICKLGDSKGTLFDIQLPKDVLLRSNSILSVDDNRIIVTGMPSVLVTNTYSTVVHSIIGFFNMSYDYDGNPVGGGITSFDDFETTFPTIKGRDSKRQISYKNTILLNDGSYIMVSQLYTADVILAKYDKNSRLLWTQSIPRKMKWNSFLGTHYNKLTGEVIILFNDDASKFGTFYSKVGEAGYVTEKELLHKDPYTYEGEQADDNEYILYTPGGKIDIRYVRVEF